MPYTQLPPPYILPAASTSALGGIKTDGTITTLDANNKLQISKNDLCAGSGTESVQLGKGQYGTATGTHSVAIGYNAEADMENDLAIGNGAQATGYDSTHPGIAIGKDAFAVNGGIQLGTGSTSSRNDFQVGTYEGNYKLLDLSTGLIPSARIPGATVANAGKYLTINSSGEIVAADLPLYNGGVN